MSPLDWYAIAVGIVMILLAAYLYFVPHCTCPQRIREMGYTHLTNCPRRKERLP